MHGYYCQSDIAILGVVSKIVLEELTLRTGLQIFEQPLGEPQTQPATSENVTTRVLSHYKAFMLITT
jgi:hypothetical protein